MKQFVTQTTSGHGRGKTLGFPTINMVIPTEMIEERHGIYATHVTIGPKTYEGALYYGPPITFGDTHDQLEVYLLDVSDIHIEKNTPLTVSLVAFIRGVVTFPDTATLIEQMNSDIRDIRTELTKNCQRP